MMSLRLDGWRFPLVLGALLCALLALHPPYYGGDVVEYALDTIALADHGTPDIRLPDIERARQLLPPLGEPLDLLERGMRAGDEKLYAAFVRGRDGAVYSVHFFGYSLLAVVPFKVFEALGIAPFKAFQVVNLAALFVLGLALRRFFGCAPKAFAGLALFMLCGGTLYWSWTSPECVTAAALLAGLLFFCSGAPVAGAVLAGLAGQQNPTILFFFGFAPLLLLCLDYRREPGLAANLRAVLTRRHMMGLAAGMAVFALPPLFNLYQYGVPNIIAKLFSDPSLVGLNRLASFYFDLNQGMIIAIPGLLATLLLWGWRGDGARQARVLAVCCLFTLAVAVPALAVLNWNSGATGVMRYAFWAAMPLLFALLVRLRDLPRWPGAVVAGLALVQVAAMTHALSYHYVTFSPVARQLLAHAPQLVHPEPEIFAERSGNHDNYIQPDKVYVYRVDGKPVKTLYNVANPAADTLLCGDGAALAPDNDVTASTRGWRYIDGPVRCLAGALVQKSYQVEQFRAEDGIKLAAGWNKPELNGPGWDGVWSEGNRSRLQVTLGGLRPAMLALAGNYLDGNRRTRVTVNGIDLGWHELDRSGPLALPVGARTDVLEIELEHEAPHAPGAADPRVLAFFLREVNVRQAAVAP